MNREEISERFSIRHYREGDFPAISEIWTSTGLSNPARGDNEKTISDSIAIGGAFLVVEEKVTGRMCGTSWMTFDGRRIHLHHFGILPVFQNNGLARFLLRESLIFVKNKGYQVKLEVHQSNKRAIRMYTMNGFTRLGDYDVYMIRDTDSINPDGIL